MLLEQVLNSASYTGGGAAAGDMEVIDLARNDCSNQYLKEILSSCFALGPDALVIFAGNNWHLDIHFSDDECLEMLNGLDHKHELEGVRRLIESKYISLTSDFMGFTADLCKAHNIPVVFVIPEYNLIDWHCNEKERGPQFLDKGLSEWIRLRTRAEQAMTQDDTGEVEALSEKMIALNGSNPYGYELLARCKLKKKRVKEAVEYFRLAHDRTIFNPYRNPGIITAVQETLRESANRHHIPIVNLPSIFNRYDKGILPDRSLFMDYSHLSARGIGIAVTHMAESLFLKLAGKSIRLDESQVEAMMPNRRVAGRAHFFAAVHNAHWGQAYDIVYYHCRKALEFSEDPAQAMLNYTSMASRRLPWVLSKDFEEINSSGIMEHYHLTQLEGDEVMDIILVDAMIRALRTAGTEIEEDIALLRKEEHSFIDGKIDLLESYYHRTYSVISSKETRSTYFKAADVQSRFFFIIGEWPYVSLKITCRLPVKNSGAQQVSLSINGKTAASFPVSDKWSSHTVRIPEELLKDGINTVTVQWPITDCRQEKHERKRHESLPAFLMRRMEPVYGEIHMFHVLKEEDFR
jgi:hypothetical protein